MAARSSDSAKPVTKTEAQAPAAAKGQPDAAQPAKAETVTAGVKNTRVEAPGFKLRDSRGFMRRMGEWRGQAVLLVFFRADCRPCRAVLDKVIAFNRLYQDSIQIVAIALLEQTNGMARLDKYLAQKHLPFPVLVDAKEEVAAQYILDGDSFTLPSLIFIDEEGFVTHKLNRVSRPLESYLEE